MREDGGGGGWIRRNNGECADSFVIEGEVLTRARSNKDLTACGEEGTK